MYFKIQNFEAFYLTLICGITLHEFSLHVSNLAEVKAK